MSFKYINPGYSGLLKNVGTGSKSDVDANGLSKTGKAFYNTNAKNVLLVPTPSEVSEIWMRFDAYLKSDDNRIEIYAGELGYYSTNPINGFFVKVNSGVATIFIRHSGTAETLADSVPSVDRILKTGLRLNAINSFWLHLKYGSAGVGFLEFRINDKRFDKIQDVDFNPANTSESGFGLESAYTSNTFFSNIICSDEEVDILETIVPARIGLTETDMSYDSDTGIYTANAIGQTILQSADVDYLNNEYGSDSAVTGIALIGNPAYKVDLGLSSLTSMTVENNVSTENETLSLLANTSSMIMSSKKLSNKTIADLQNFKFGWKAGA